MVKEKKEKLKFIYGKRKQAFIFSLLSIITVLIFSVMVLSMMDVVNPEEEYLENRVKTLTTYHSLLKGNYLKSVLESSTRAAIYAIVNYTIDEQKFIPNSSFQDVYQQTIYNGTFSYNDSGVIRNCTNCESLMLNKTLSYWASLVENYSEAVVSYATDVNIAPHPSSIRLSQEDPWYITVVGAFNISFESSEFNITDNKHIISSKVSIINISDPYYGVYAKGNGSRKIIRNPDKVFQITNIWNRTILNDSIYNEYYFKSSRGRNLLMRIQNISYFSDENPSSTGIESLINYNSISNPASTLFSYNSSNISRRSFVDTYFFTDKYFPCHSTSDSNYFLFNVTNISLGDQWMFRLDRAAYIEYQGNATGIDSGDVVCSMSTLIP